MFDTFMTQSDLTFTQSKWAVYQCNILYSCCKVWPCVAWLLPQAVCNKFCVLSAAGSDIWAQGWEEGEEGVEWSGSNREETGRQKGRIEVREGAGIDILSSLVSILHPGP